MKKGATVLLVLLLASSVVYAKGCEVQKKAGEYDVTITVNYGTGNSDETAPGR